MKSNNRINLVRFGAVQNELMKHVWPALPFMAGYDPNVKGGFHNESIIRDDLWAANKSDLSKMFFPLALRKESDSLFWALPFEPFVTISGKNVVIKRNVSKAAPAKEEKKSIGGTIKERWSQDDYTVTITGVLIGAYETGGVDRCYPKEDVRKLHDYLTTPERIDVMCTPLQELGIHYLVVESFSFPYTKGESVQGYEIQCVSDGGYELLEETTDV